MIIGLVSDFLPECKSKRSFGLFIHHAGTFGVKVLSMFLKFMFADSRIGKVLTPKDLRHSDPIMVRDTLSSKDASSHQI